MQTDTVLNLKNIRLSYLEHVVLEHIDLQLKAGEVLGILGRVGAGKTQLLRLISGLEVQDAGEIHILPPAHPGEVSYIFQEDLLIPWLTVEDNLALCLRRPEQQRRGADFQIEELMSLRPPQLSGGMRQKINLARGFINSDALLLMDEPFNRLDLVEKRQLHIEFLKLQKRFQTSVVFVTHDIDEAIFLCDRIAFLTGGRLQSTIANPFRGQLVDRELIADRSYQELRLQLMELYQ